MKPTHHFVPSVRFCKAKSTARNGYIKIKPIFLSILQLLYQRYTLLYMSLCSVLRKVAVGTDIGGLEISDILN